jgi:4-hydroxybenzoate polyprenyltransferase
MNLRSYAQLVRLPNVFTALADISIAVLATGAVPGRWLTYALLFLASACLYCGGMVWNDFFDVEQDKKERPFRPIPSGRVSRWSAARFGGGLLASGWIAACLAGWHADGWRPAGAIVAAILVGAIPLYDGWLKRTWAGPLGMGACRFLNVLLGWTVAVHAGWPWSIGFYLALLVGIYIVGVTWFARTEARQSSQSALTAAAVVMLGALGLVLLVPVLAADVHSPYEPSVLFPYLLVAFGFLVGMPVSQAISRPTPAFVQAAVKWAVLGLVGLDTILATALVGTVGLVILVLLLPALYLGRWIYST